MNLNQYNSFEEIDQRLKILKLKREIDKESLKLNWKNSKASLYPINVLYEFRGFLLKKLLILIKNRSFFL
jgi:hypothetical protein